MLPNCAARRRRAVSPASVQECRCQSSAPDDHFIAGPDRRVKISGIGRVGSAGGCPAIRAGIVSPASVDRQGSLTSSPAPDDHFIAGPDCGVIESAVGRISGAGSCPTIRAGIISSAGVQQSHGDQSTPDDHFAASPYCGVKCSAIRRISRAGGRPTIRGWDHISRQC